MKLPYVTHQEVVRNIYGDTFVRFLVHRFGRAKYVFLIKETFSSFGVAVARGIYKRMGAPGDVGNL